MYRNRDARVLCNYFGSDEYRKKVLAMSRGLHKKAKDSISVSTRKQSKSNVKHEKPKPESQSHVKIVRKMPQKVTILSVFLKKKIENMRARNEDDQDVDLQQLLTYPVIGH